MDFVVQWINALCAYYINLPVWIFLWNPELDQMWMTEKDFLVSGLY